ncbi:Rhs element Vgr protein [Caballeronia sordidicola]|uniref:Rhs element Vgr protein n=1 Tax=Caballeronia sordidicola TaxID=196367 RepID=A0A158IHQ1_CABSO|nr:Rhs element Vgr protein [Caballeronia sordidicola]
MHLAAPAFSPKMTPFVVGCDSWNGSAGSIPTSHLPRREKSAAPTKPSAVALADSAPTQGTIPAAPELLTSESFQQGANTDQTHSTAQVQASPKNLTNADQEPKGQISNEIAVPIKLTAAEYCDWSIPSFTTECRDRTETAAYYGLDAKKNSYPTPDPRGNRKLTAGQFDTAFELSFDENSKTLYATIRVKLVPVDLHACDAYGTVLPGPDGKPQSVPFHHDLHWKTAGLGVGKPSNGLVLKYRDGTGSHFNVATKRQQIEAVLNAHGSKLILNGCSKNAACGCRVSVVFRVQLLLSINDAPVADGKPIHKIINLFPRTQRADAGSWGEINMFQQAQSDGRVVWADMPSDTNVIAHECGHLFNYPDEYWELGGWVHEQYIKDQELNFALGISNRGKETWQISSDKNLMGGGANIPISTGKATSPTATVHPYYLEYIRQHFCELTGETPQHLNGDAARRVWRRWRVGYNA